MSCHFLCQKIFQTQGSNPGLLLCMQIFFKNTTVSDTRLNWTEAPRKSHYIITDVIVVCCVWISSSLHSAFCLFFPVLSEVYLTNFFKTSFLFYKHHYLLWCFCSISLIFILIFIISVLHDSMFSYCSFSGFILIWVLCSFIFMLFWFPINVFKAITFLLNTALVAHQVFDVLILFSSKYFILFH